MGHPLAKTQAEEWHLESFADVIRRYLENPISDSDRERAYKGIQDFCFGTDPHFKAEFAHSLGFSELPDIQLATRKPALTGFVQTLARKSGMCVFMLRDTYESFKEYQKDVKPCLGITVNRKYCCRDDQDYYQLVGLFYDSFLRAETAADFLTYYLAGFKTLIDSHDHFRKCSDEIWRYLSDRIDSEQDVCFVDYGFQFTFSLFCLASLSLNDTNRNVTFYSYSVYPWLREKFKDHYYSLCNEDVFGLEETGAGQFKHSMTDKARGVMMGFGIGDALGYPAAGINHSDLPAYISQGISGFEENPSHPYFKTLKKGQYTANTQSMLIAARGLVSNKGFDAAKHARDLVDWVRQDSNSIHKRWPGPTMMKAVECLERGISLNEAGSTDTQSCSSLYRTIPLAIYYRPFSRPQFHELAGYAELSGSITHNSDISKAGCAFLAVFLAELMCGIAPEHAVKEALKVLKQNPYSQKLRSNIELALEKSRDWTMNEARRYFGTGSPMFQTLPLAIFCFFKFRDSFEDTVLAAANSFRHDNEEEIQRLRGLSFEQQLIQARGGNTDGIAAVTGAISGAYLGYEAIPEHFRSVENSGALLQLGDMLVS